MAFEMTENKRVFLRGTFEPYNVVMCKSYDVKRDTMQLRSVTCLA